MEVSLHPSGAAASRRHVGMKITLGGRTVHHMSDARPEISREEQGLQRLELPRELTPRALVQRREIQRILHGP